MWGALVQHTKSSAEAAVGAAFSSSKPPSLGNVAGSSAISMLTPAQERDFPPGNPRVKPSADSGQLTANPLQADHHSSARAGAARSLALSRWKASRRSSDSHRPPLAVQGFPWCSRSRRNPVGRLRRAACCRRAACTRKRREQAAGGSLALARCSLRSRLRHSRPGASSPPGRRPAPPQQQ